MRRKVWAVAAAIVLIAAGGLYVTYRFLPIKRDMYTPFGEHYRGMTKNGRFDGQGRLTFPAGGPWVFYEGEFKNNLRHGQGRQIWKIGQQYQGQWRNGLASGRGLVTFAPDWDELSYEGELVDFVYHGQGTLIWKNGQKYEGQWQNGQMHGRGLVTFAPDKGKLSYEGELADNQYHGWGVMIWKNGTRYEGQWRNGQANGSGTMFYPPDDPEGRASCTGDFVDGECGGDGLIIWRDDRKHEGHRPEAIVSDSGV